MADKETETEPTTGFQNIEPDAHPQKEEIHEDLEAFASGDDSITAKNDTGDEPVKEVLDKPVDEKDKQQLKQDIKTNVAEVTDKINAGTATTDDVETLKQQLKFYEDLFGPAQIQTQTPQAKPAATNIATAVQQETFDPYADVQVTENDLIEFLSGDPSRALPILKKFIAGAVEISNRTISESMVKQQRANQYQQTIQGHFYSKYQELKQYPQIVKVAGDEVEQALRSRGINKMPHELLDVVAKRAIQILDSIRGTNGTPQKSTGSRQGTAVTTKVATSTPDKLTDQQKEMFDLLNE